MLFHDKLKILVFGEDELVNRIKNKDLVYRNIVSIADPGSNVPEEIANTAQAILEMRFLDLDGPLPNHNPVNEIMPELHDINNLIKFYGNVNKEEGFTIHCWQGLSRSTAIALCILHLYYRNERIAFRELKKIRPYSKPNTRILNIFDSLYGTRLSDKAKQIKIRNVHQMYSNYKNKNDFGELLDIEKEET